MEEIIEIVRKALYASLHPVRVEMMPATGSNCLLVKKKAEFFLGSLPNINNFEVECIPEEEYFLLTVEANLTESGDCHFTLRV